MLSLCAPTSHKSFFAYSVIPLSYYNTYTISPAWNCPPQKSSRYYRASTKQYVQISCTLTTCYLIGGTLFQLIQIHFRISNLGSITIKKMVFFCCDGCGETFKKAKVDQHAAKCRECYAVSW